MRRRRKERENFLLNFYSCFLLPGYTLLFAGSVQWFSTNFSVLAVTGADHYRGFLVWGVLAGAYFLVLLGRLAHTLTKRWQRRGMYLLLIAAVVCLGAGLPLPYLPTDYPEVAKLHIFLIFSACVWMMGAILFLLLSFRREDGSYRGLVWAWWAIVAGCGVLFVLSGIISTALEVFFTLSAAQLVRSLWQRRMGKIS